MDTTQQPVPFIEGWPYTDVHCAYEEFCHANRKEPRLLLVGHRLWSLLVNADEAKNFKNFYAVNAIPIKLDKVGILEPSEFMFTR